MRGGSYKLAHNQSIISPCEFGNSSSISCNIISRSSLEIFCVYKPHIDKLCRSNLGVLVTIEYWVKKSKAEHLYSALHGIQTTLKRSGMDHTVLPATNTMSALFRKRSPDGATID